MKKPRTIRVTPRVEQRAAQQIPTSSIDGVARPAEIEHELNLLAAAAFSTPGAQKFLAYLKAITINHVHGPAVDKDELLHIEGQRYLVGIIDRRVENGRRRK